MSDPCIQEGRIARIEVQTENALSIIADVKKDTGTIKELLDNLRVELAIQADREKSRKEGISVLTAGLMTTASAAVGAYFQKVFS